MEVVGNKTDFCEIKRHPNKWMSNVASPGRMHNVSFNTDA